MNLSGIYQRLKRELNNIEKDLEMAIESKDPILYEASLKLLKAGGKRIRPIFVLLTSKFGDKPSDDSYKVAVALELIHMASLVHDDVIDDSDLRRGHQTVKSRWDNRIAMYTGDFIFARALRKITEIKNPQIHQILSSAFEEMCLGEIEQIKDQFNWEQNLRTYLLRIKRKTALLMAVSCQLGALSSGVPYPISRKLYYFGYFSGMAFQITDDILDFVGTEKQLGKPAGSDIKQGNVTLPALISFEDKMIKNQVSTLTSYSSEENWPTIIDRIKASGGVEKAQALSDQYLNKAYHILETLPKIKEKDYLREIANYIGRRKY